MVNEMSSQLGLPQNECLRILNMCLDIVGDNLAKGDTIVMQGFGSLRPWKQTQRMGRNPRNGKPCSIEPRTSVKFKPGKFLLDKLNGK